MNATLLGQSHVTHRSAIGTAFLAALTILPLSLLTAQTKPTSVEHAADTKVILVTGSTDGLGREVARHLANSGAHVIIHGRNRARGDSLVKEIETSGRGSARFYVADFASLDAVRALAAAVDRDYDRLDALVNNAGIWINRGPRQVSADGYELHFAVNYLAGYVLTNALLPKLRASAPSRIVNVSSIAQRAIEFDDVMLENGYSGQRGYGQSKLAQVLFTIDLAEDPANRGIMVNAVHPATLMNTTMVEKSGVAPRSSVAEGAEAVLQLVTADGVGTGKFFDGIGEARANGQAYDKVARAKLKELSDSLTKKR